MVDTPSAPDPAQTAATQAGLNTDSAVEQNLINMTNKVGPWGSTTYTPTGSATYVNSQGQTINLPQYTQTTEYNPAQQAIFDKTTDAQTNIADIASQQSNNLKNYLNTVFKFDDGQSFSGPSSTAPQSITAPAYKSSATFSPTAYQSTGDFSYGNQGAFNPANFSYTGSDAQNAAYDLASKRILPQQQQATDALRTQLINQGIRPGTAAWNQQMTLNSQANNDQLNQLALTGQQQFYNQALGTAQNNYNQQAGARQLNDNEALSTAQQNFNQHSTDQTNAYNQALGTQQQNVAQTTADQTNAFNQQLAATGANNSSSLAAQQAAYQQALAARQQNYQEAVTGRNQPINEITALLSGSQLQNPNSGTSATPQSSVAGVDYSGLVENQYNQQVASNNAMLGGLFGLAGTAATAGIKYSDARVKKDIVRVGYLDNGLPVYSYRYLWDDTTEIGVLAQDVEKVRPAAVHEVNGIKAVDYGMATA